VVEGHDAERSLAADVQVLRDMGEGGGDLDQLKQIARTYPTRGSFLSELTLDPPEATSAEAVPPRLYADYLALSTILSAKGQERDVAMTRARQHLHVMQPICRW
jgi:hypothetical protein